MASSPRSKKPNNSEIIEILSSDEGQQQTTQESVRASSNAAAGEIVEIPSGSDDDSDDSEPSSPQVQAPVAVDAERSATAVSSASDELHPAFPQPRRPDQDQTTTQRAAAQGATNTVSASRNTNAPHSARDQSRPSSNKPSQQSRNPLPRDLTRVHAPVPSLLPRKRIIPGGLATEQLHLPPSERKSQPHFDTIFRNLVEYGSLSGPDNGIENDPRRMPSRREMVERARTEMLERDEEVRREAERERERREGLEGERERAWKGRDEREEVKGKKEKEN